MTPQDELSSLTKARNAFEEFVKSQAFSGVLLVLCTIVALIWANSPKHQSYEHINHIMIGLYADKFVLAKSLMHWVNDGFMAIFFLLVGLEIKREVISGELSAMSKAILPIAAAIGGMVVPAVIYVAINHNHMQNMSGWAIPMATDIAFAIGILSLLSKRIPRSLIILLSAIAIVDDLGAVIVIAVFYSKSLSTFYLLVSLFLFVVLVIFNRFGVRKLWPYLTIGIFLWYALLQSGVHATIAGVLIALTIPSNGQYRPDTVSKHLHNLMSKFDTLRDKGQVKSESRKGILQSLENLVHEVETPLQRLEHALLAPVNYFIIPIFVLLNAGVMIINMNMQSVITNPLTLGIIAGLVLGKPIGIFGSTWLMQKLGLGKLPTGINFMHIFGMSLLAGIGFTMSIFISELGFGEFAHQLILAKAGILAASLVSAVLGYIILRYLSIRKY